MPIKKKSIQTSRHNSVTPRKNEDHANKNQKETQGRTMTNKKVNYNYRGIYLH